MRASRSPRSPKCAALIRFHEPLATALRFILLNGRGLANLPTKTCVACSRMTFWITPCCPPSASVRRPRRNLKLASPWLAPRDRSLSFCSGALSFHLSCVGTWLGSQSWKSFVRPVVGETVTVLLRSYPRKTFVRSSSDLAQLLELSSQICLCLGVRISRPGAGPLEGVCFPRLTAMYLAEAKPPVLAPCLDTISTELCVKELMGSLWERRW